jgi:hypothetical protein
MTEKKLFGLNLPTPPDATAVPPLPADWRPPGEGLARALMEYRPKKLPESITRLLDPKAEIRE